MSQLWFSVTRLHRDDFRSYLPEKIVSEISDEEMSYYAEKIANAIMESGVYWEAIRQITDEIKEEYGIEE